MALGQHSENLELPMRETQIALGAGGGPATEINRDGGEPDRCDGGLYPAQNGIDSRDQLFHVERFCYAVIGPETKAREFVSLLPSRRQDDDRRLSAVPQHPRELETADIGQHHVQEDEIGDARAIQGERAIGTRGPFNFESIHEQVVAKDLGQRRVVFHNQDSWPHSVAAFGIISVAVVPWPTSLVISSVPS